MSTHQIAGIDNLTEIQEVRRTLESLASEREGALCPMEQSSFDSHARQLIRDMPFPEKEKDKLLAYYQTLVTNAEPEYTH